MALPVHRYSSIVAGFDDFCAVRLSQLTRDLDREVARARARLVEARKVQHQAICDYDLDQQPLHFASALGPRARTLSQLEGDDED